MSAVIVFVLALLFITAVELISGKPLSAIFGGADSGTTLKNLVNPSPAPATTPTATTTTTSTTPDVGLHHDDEHGETRPAPPAGGRRDDDDDDPCRVDDDHHDHVAERATTDDVDLGPTEGRRVAGYQPLNSAGRRSTKLAMPSLESRVFVTSSCPMASS